MTEELLEVPLQNTGFIDGSGTDNLWLGGTIPYEIILPSGDWRPFLPTVEKQRNPTETMACVSFSHNSILEIQTKQQTGQEPNYSDRFVAKMSGTTHSGNRFDTVAETVRKNGVVKEEDWSTVAGWENYYSEIPQSVKDKAIKLDIAYEKIVPSETELMYHLKHAPLQISIKLPNPNHAVVLVHIENGIAYYFDSYVPFLKTIEVTKIARAFKIVLKGNMTNSLIVKNGSEYGIFDPATSEDGLITLMRNRGIPVPLKPDGKLDWDRVKVDKQLI